MHGPLQDYIQILTQEYLKGEIAGIITFREMVPTTIELIDSFIKDKLEEKENVQLSSDGD